MGFFDLFKKRESAPKRTDLFELLGCDIHSHFIPGIDDGAQNLEQSINMLKGMKELGYRKVITTPHIMSDFYQNTRESIYNGLNLLNAELKRQQVEIEVEAAAEYYLDFDFPAKIVAEKLLTFGSNYLLFELSFLNAPDSLFQVIFELQTRGYKPVLAHPERYPYWYRTPEKYQEIKEKGVLLQLNLNSISGAYSPDARRIGEWLIEHNLIDFIGSDCHHDGHIGLMKKSIQHPLIEKLIDSGRLLNHTLC